MNIIVNGKSVPVSDNFKELSPEDQDATVDEIAASMSGKQQPMPWADVGRGALQNAPGDALDVAKSFYHLARHPVQSLGAIGEVVGGGLGNLGLNPMGVDQQQLEEAKQTATAFGQQQKENWGGVENIKRYVSQKPISALLDAETVAAPALGLARKAGMLPAKVARVAEAVPTPMSAAGLIGKAGTEILGGHTGVGGASLRAGRDAGLAGKSDVYLANKTGRAPMTNILDMADNAMDNLVAQRGSQYQQGIKDLAINEDKRLKAAGVTNFSKKLKVLDMAPIDNAVNEAAKINTFKGINLAPDSEAMLQKITDTVNKWKSLDPEEYHTAMGFDALKQSMNNVRTLAKPGTPERLMADKVYHAIKNQIVMQDPAYAKVMKDYSEASDMIKELRQTFSLNPNASADTQIRKLQSILRNDVNANYGRRAQLGKVLEEAGAPDLMAALAGQSHSSILPRGLSKYVAGSTAGAGLTALIKNPAPLSEVSPKLAAAAALYLGSSSPYITGGAYHKAGQAMRFVNKITGRAIPKAIPKSKDARRALELMLYQTGKEGRRQIPEVTLRRPAAFAPIK